MRKEKWKLWIENNKLVDSDFNTYLNKKVIKRGATKTEIKGHLNKAKRNLRFARKVIDDFKDYYEWAIVAYYYAVYQSALSLCASKGFKTKQHLATILILIKFFYPKQINKDDLKTIIKSSLLNEEDLKEFVELKKYRETAAYSISINYEKSLAEDLGKQAIDFVNKIQSIIETEE